MIAPTTIENPAPASRQRERSADGSDDDAGSSRQHTLGQFLTPAPLADFMASMFSGHRRSIRLLDAGAGAGALTMAMVHRLCAKDHRPVSIEVTAYEVDPSVTPQLRANLNRCQAVCHAAGVAWSATIRTEDFIESAVSMVRRDMFAPAIQTFNAAIVNPPYRKIQSDSSHRLALRSAGIETTNLYTAFLSLIIRLLDRGGQMVAITPRSFCNGPYFRPFRDDLLQQMAIRRVHVFESRSAAFGGDDVLQENIIFHASKSTRPLGTVAISTSSGAPGGAVHTHRVPFAQVVSPTDPERFIHLVTDRGQAKAKETIGRFSATLAALGLSASTGRVVDFRATEFLREKPTADTVPLIYPCHFNGGTVHWPKEKGRKPNAIVATDQTRSLLVPSAVYVLVKRFTSKEERRRVVACIYDPAQLPPFETVGFENHLNYFHADGRGLPMNLARGLAAYLNSTLVDTYFRQFNGHTQVNATDLRNLPYPTRDQLARMGAKARSATQQDIDAIVGEELHARA